MRRPGLSAAMVLIASSSFGLNFAGCTTEFTEDGGACLADDQCEVNQICWVVPAEDGAEDKGICLQQCADDGDCSGLRGEVCRPLPDGRSAVCTLECVIDSDCPAEQRCAFGQCSAPISIVDGGAPSLDQGPEPDAAASDEGIDVAVDDGIDAGAGDAAAQIDASPDAGTSDSGVEPDAAVDAQPPADGAMAGAPDVSAPDASVADAAP